MFDPCHCNRIFLGYLSDKLDSFLYKTFVVQADVTERKLSHLVTMR